MPGDMARGHVLPKFQGYSLDGGEINSLKEFNADSRRQRKNRFDNPV